MIAPKLLLVCLLAVAFFAVPCMSLSRIACNNVKQGMDVTGTHYVCILICIAMVTRVFVAGAVRSFNSPDGMRNVKDKV
jgi:hypothetical protein